MINPSCIQTMVNEKKNENSKNSYHFLKRIISCE